MSDTQPETKRRPTAREVLSDMSERILATRYAGQVRPVVIERALMPTAAADDRRTRTASQRAGGRP
ncbi:hypothetical protein [Streptomyces bullii]|uniref:Uncharacterized protein n=1 Tax=Streptomyces bullii TaxID=349910 RepID=A0ABW0UXI2_9ACTN